MNNFLAKNAQLDYVDGLYFTIASTKDNQIIIFDIVKNNAIDLGNIETQAFNTISEAAITLLKTFLDTYSQLGSKKKIFLEFLLSPNIFSYNIIHQYVLTVLTLISQYPNIVFYLCSSNQNILAELKRFDMEYPIGYIIYPGNYIDVDFYIFPVPLLSKDILTEQFELQKDIMITIDNWDELNYLNAILEMKSVQNTKFKDQLYVIGEYPEIIYKVLSEQKN